MAQFTEMTGQGPNEIERLYGLPREDFIGARAELARRLKDGGRKDEAAQVAALRKPTVAAWAVNQVARAERSMLGELIEAGERLQKAQMGAASGRGADEFRAATQARRRLIGRLVEAAAAILEESGSGATPSNLEQVANTFEAIATDQESLDRIRRGVLERHLLPGAGFGGPAGLRLVEEQAEEEPVEPARRGRAAPPTKMDLKARERADRLARQADEAKSEARRLAEEAAKAERVAIRARSEAARAEERATKARERAERASADLDR